MRIRFSQKAIDFGLAVTIQNPDGTWAIGVDLTKLKEWHKLYPGELPAEDLPDPDPEQKPGPRTTRTRADWEVGP